MERMIADLTALLEALDAVEHATTPGEEAAAKLRLEIETTLQAEAGRERLRQRILNDLRNGEGLGNRRLLDELLGPGDDHPVG